MKVDVKVISAESAAHHLRVKLGDMRAWVSFLADCRRDRQDIAGFRLHPCAVREGLPVYAADDVREFVKNVLAAVPSAGPCPIRLDTLRIDRRRPWRINRFNKDGSPKARAVTPGGTCRAA